MYSLPILASKSRVKLKPINLLFYCHSVNKLMSDYWLILQINMYIHCILKFAFVHCRYHVTHVSSKKKFLVDGTIKLCFEQASCSLDLTLFQDLPLGYQSCVPTDPVPFQGLSIFELLNKLMHEQKLNKILSHRIIIFCLLLKHCNGQCLIISKVINCELFLKYPILSGI